jgi:hypothetical protein
VVALPAAAAILIGGVLLAIIAVGRSSPSPRTGR